MTNIIPVRFDSFKGLIGRNGSRVYYFIGENYYDFHFVFEGFIVKTTLLKREVENPQRFFSDQMFYNAIELTFNIPYPKTNLLESIAGFPQPLDKPILVEEVQDEETKNEDIQEEGVDELPL